MNDRPLDVLTRRASLLATDVMGLAGMRGNADPRTAKARNKKKNISRTAKQKCRSQLGQCLEVFKTLAGCADPVQCLAIGERCCPFLESCDVTGFFTCQRDALDSPRVSRLIGIISG
jgi:hypothetical protein